MYCTNCGININKESKFCPNCGNQNIQLNLVNHSNKKTKRRKIIAVVTIIISILGLFCTIGLPFFVFLLEMLTQLLFGYKTIEGDPVQKLELGDFFKSYFPNFNNSTGMFSSHSLTLIVIVLLSILLITSIIYIVKTKKVKK